MLPTPGTIVGQATRPRGTCVVRGRSNSAWARSSRPQSVSMWCLAAQVLASARKSLASEGTLHQSGTFDRSGLLVPPAPPTASWDFVCPPPSLPVWTSRHQSPRLHPANDSTVPRLTARSLRPGPNWQMQEREAWLWSWLNGPHAKGAAECSEMRD